MLSSETWAALIGAVVGSAMTIVGTAIFESRARRSVVRPHVALVQLSCIEIATSLAATEFLLDEDRWMDISPDLLDREVADLERRINTAPEYLTPEIIISASKLAWEVRRLRECIEHRAGPDMVHEQVELTHTALQVLDRACSKA